MIQPSTTPRERDLGCSRNRRVLPALCTATVVCAAFLVAQLLPSSPGVDVLVAQETQAQLAKAVEAGKKFLDALDEAQRGKAVYEFNSPKKSGWSNLPVTAVPRNGVRMGDLNKAQRDAALELVAAVLSKEGYQKIIDIMDGDQQLAMGKGGGKGGKGDKGKGDKGKGSKGGKGGFGVDNYYLAVFGKPSLTEPWFVQFGGHHLGLNVTIIEKNFVLTPTHTGAQPTNFTRDGQAVRPLGPENDRAFELISMLDAKQQAQAIIAQTPTNLQLGPGQDNKKIEPKGIKGSALSAAQQAKLLEIVAAWVNIVHGDSAAARMTQIKSEITDTHFAWWGPTTNGSAVYYRIQGPTLVIEYAPQGGTDHIHTIIRNPVNDYGQKRS